ncbi:hypothetical protein A2U01_0070331, partial [Trifolium medium]|nr:hypothetical protein [Trifolium medium]
CENRVLRSDKNSGGETTVPDLQSGGWTKEEDEDSYSTFRFKI